MGEHGLERANLAGRFDFNLLAVTLEHDSSLAIGTDLYDLTTVALRDKPPLHLSGFSS